MFFDEYPRFFDTSEVAPDRGRLNLRYEAIFGANRDIFDGARVLDLACNDGRWSFAALRTGAAHVTGIEARPELIDSAQVTFTHYGQYPDTYRFVCDDVFTALNNHEFEVDVILNLGYIYHTTRHTELLSHLRALDPTYMIVDSHVLPRTREPLLKVRRERPYRQGTAVLDPYARNGVTLVGLPSVPALQLMLEAYDFGIQHVFDWKGLIAEHPEEQRVRDYAMGGRVTLRCRAGAPTASVVEAAALAAASTTADQQSPAEYETAQISPEEQPATSATPGWHHLVNRSLARTTGYELRRAADRRG